MSDHVPPEEEILKWLPVKTLLRFRCVCKSWKKMIDSPFFAQLHLAVQNRRLIIKFEHEKDLLVLDPCDRTSVETLSIPLAFAETLYEFDPEQELVLETFRLVGTLHGVVCLYDHSMGDQPKTFLIWNPSVRKSLSISLPPDPLHFDWNTDYVDNHPYFGFWIHLSGQHFKILVLKLASRFDDDGNKSMGGLLYSSISGKWELVPLDQLKDLRSYPENPPVMIDGVAYWIAYRDPHTDSEGKEFWNIGVFSFDFAQECINTIQVPDCKNHHMPHYPVLCILQDALALAYWQQDSDRCNVLIRNAVEGIWVKLYAFELPLGHSFRALWVTGQTEDTCRVIAQTDDHLLLFDTKGKEDRTVLKTRWWEYCSNHAAYGFKESLLC